MTSDLGRDTSCPGVVPPAFLQGQGLKSLLCQRRGSRGRKRLPRRPGWVEKRFGWLQRRREGNGNSCSRALPVWPPGPLLPRGWSEDGRSTRVPSSECCGKRPGAPRGSRDTRGQPRRRARLLSHVRTSQDAPACPRAGGTGGTQPRAGPSTCSFSAAARPDGAPAGGCGPGRWDGGGSGAVYSPRRDGRRHGLSPASAPPPGSALLARAEVPRCKSERCGGDFPSLCILKD